MGEAGLPGCKALRASWKSWDGDAFQGSGRWLSGSLLCRHKNLSWGVQHPQSISGVAVHTCNPRAWGAETGRSRVSLANQPSWNSEVQVQWETRPQPRMCYLSGDTWSQPDSTQTWVDKCTPWWTATLRKHITCSAQWSKWLQRKIRNLAVYPLVTGSEVPSSSTNYCFRNQSEKMPSILTLLRVKPHTHTFLWYTIVAMFYIVLLLLRSIVPYTLNQHHHRCACVRKIWRRACSYYP